MSSLVESPFDSDYYGVRVGKLTLASTSDLAPMLVAAKTRYDVMFLRVDEAKVEILAGLEPRRRLETLVTLERPRTSPPPLIQLTGELELSASDVVADPAVLATIGSITVAAIRTSHLHGDPRLPAARTRALYAEWARNDARGRAQQTFIARRRGVVVGYLTALRSCDIAVIDLVAVDPQCHGQGVGTALVASFVTWAFENGLAMRVGTQATNRASVLYERFGFAPAARHATFHLWLDEP